MRSLSLFALAAFTVSAQEAAWKLEKSVCRENWCRGVVACGSPTGDSVEAAHVAACLEAHPGSVIDYTITHAPWTAVNNNTIDLAAAIETIAVAEKERLIQPKIKIESLGVTPALASAEGCKLEFRAGKAVFETMEELRKADHPLEDVHTVQVNGVPVQAAGTHVCTVVLTPDAREGARLVVPLAVAQGGPVGNSTSSTTPATGLTGASTAPGTTTTAAVVVPVKLGDAKCAEAWCKSEVCGGASGVVPAAKLEACLAVAKANQVLLQSGSAPLPALVRGDNSTKVEIDFAPVLAKVGRNAEKIIFEKETLIPLAANSSCTALTYKTADGTVCNTATGFQDGAHVNRQHSALFVEGHEADGSTACVVRVRPESELKFEIALTEVAHSNGGLAGLSTALLTTAALLALSNTL